MKKGCFIRSIIILTILVAAVLYIVKNHFDDLIVKPGKGLLENIVNKDIDTKLSFIKENPEKDSLKTLLKEYVSRKLSNINFSDDDNDVNIKLDKGEVKINSKDSTSSNSDISIDKIINSINVYLKDSLVDNSDLNKIKKILKEDINERPKKN